MGDIGHYIDQLPDDARDRIITAQGWCTESLSNGRGERCLIGHVAGLGFPVGYGEFSARVHTPHPAALGCLFDELAARVGLDEAVRLVKARAARTHRIPLSSAPSQLDGVQVGGER